jgi:hypothetical protein
MRINYVALLLLVTASVICVQAQCTQKLSDLPSAPELLGFRLGMTKVEVKGRVPQTRFGRTDDFGVSKTTINPYFDPTIDKTKFESVRSVSLELLDERVTSLWIGYDETFKVQDIDQFAKMISTSLKLAGTWSPWKGRGQQLKCSDFQIFLTTIAGGPSLRIVDVGAEEAVATRRQEKEEKDAAAAEALGSAEAPDELVGDKKAKVYYLATCGSAKDVADANRVVFKSAEEAEKAGFKLAKNCQ